MRMALFRYRLDKAALVVLNTEWHAQRYGRTSMSLLRTKARVAVFATAVLLTAATPLVAQSAKENGMDASVRPGDDFYRYANGEWLRATAIPAGQSSYDNRAMLT